MLKRRLWQIECTNDIIVQGCIYTDDEKPNLIERGIGFGEVNWAMKPDNTRYENDLEILDPEREMYGMCLINKGPGGLAHSTDWAPITLSEAKGFFTAILSEEPDFEVRYDEMFDGSDDWEEDQMIKTPMFDCMIVPLGTAQSLAI